MSWLITESSAPFERREEREEEREKTYIYVERDLVALDRLVTGLGVAVLALLDLLDLHVNIVDREEKAERERGENKEVDPGDLCIEDLKEEDEDEDKECDVDSRHKLQRGAWLEN